VVRVEEMAQSLRIIEQCMKNMPAGDYKADHPQATPPRKEKTMHDIETLITHFLNVSWGPDHPAGRGFCGIEAARAIRVLPHQRWQHDVVPHAYPHAELPAHANASPHRQGRDGFGPARHSRQYGLCAGGH
jgi:hypothetical protein